MDSIVRNEQEIKEAISDQLIYIKNSCDLFKGGCQVEAIRIATAINVLLEKRKKTKGILWETKYPFTLLSTVPEVEEVNLDRLIVTEKSTFDEANKFIQNMKEAIRENKLFLLQYIVNLNNWHLFSFNNDGNEVSCFITELVNHININNAIRPLPIEKWVKKYSADSHNISDEGKRIVISHLNFLLGYQNFYVPYLYFPMVQYNINDKSHSTRKSFPRKYVSMEKWLNEIIFNITDDDGNTNILTRNELIASARDQDGGGHFDIKLKISVYYKSKNGIKIAELGGEDITTDNFHLFMLAQLGYEVLNSPSITNYLRT